jgi:branched-chain amino acid transport system permease protein
MISQVFFNGIVMGLLLGGLYALVGLGLALSFGVMKIVNLAHGDFVILSCYFAFTLQTLLGIDPVVSILFLPLIFFGIGFTIQKLVITRALRINPHAPVIITFAISIILQNICLLVWTPLSRGLLTYFSLSSLTIGNLSVPLVYLSDFAMALIVMMSLAVLLKRSYLGIAIRASSNDWIAAQLMGINTDHIYAITLGLSLAISAISGIFLGLAVPFTPTSGVTYLLISFGIVVIGGLGSMLGCFFGGIVIGLIHVLSGLLLGTGWQLFCVCLAMLLLLSLRGDRRG